MLHKPSFFVFVLALATALGVGCGGGDDAGVAGNCNCGPNEICKSNKCVAIGDGGAGSGGTGGGSTIDASTADLESITVEPASAALVSTNGSTPTQQFKAIGHYKGGGTAELSNANFDLDPLLIGTLDNSGSFTAGGVYGGTATVIATSGSLKGTATVTVSVEKQLYENGAPTDSAQKFGSPTQDPTNAIDLVYPLDKAVMPQNVYPANLQWENGAAGDVFRLTLKKPHYTLEAYVLHSGAGFTNSYLVDGQVWSALAQSDTDDPMTLTAERWDSATQTAIASAKQTTLTFAKAALTGSVYYWDITAVRIKRIDDGVGTAISFMPTPPASVGGQNCVGCHSVSNNGRYMAGRLGPGENIGGVFDLTVDLTAAPPPTVFPLNNAPLSNSSVRWWFSSWSPDDKRLVVTTDEGATRTMKVYDPMAGTEVAVTGALPTAATQPSWSPDGKNIAYVSSANAWGGQLTSGDISLLPVTGPDAVGAPQVLVTGASLAGEVPAGNAACYPSWAPGSDLIAFAHGNGSRSETDQSALYVMNADGSNVRRLDTANGGAQTTDNFQPHFSPFDQGGYYWVSFLSRRDYGNAQAGTKGSAYQQIWVAAIKKNAAPGEDPSAVGYWLPGQDVKSRNIAAFWAPRPCRPTGEACSVDSECCGGDCHPDSTGKLACSPPPPEKCRKSNETCSSTGDCCQGLTCIGNVCTNPPQ